MFNIKPRVGDGYEPNITYKTNAIILHYPKCPNNHDCSHYEFSLPPGRYYIECYGGSGGRYRGGATTFLDPYTNSCIPQSIVEQYGGNTVCSTDNSPGAGGYIGGLLTLNKRTKLFAYIGGSGVYTSPSYGGFNGGGNANLTKTSSSGGGATDLRVEENDVFHRIIVAGGGGGSDDSIQNDGIGGAGGFPEVA